MMGIYDSIVEMLESNGFIMLNESLKHLSICGLGGNWEEAIRLIKGRKGFLTKLIDGKSTFLSVNLYLALRHHQKSGYLEEQEKLVYEFIKENGPVDTTLLKKGVPIENKEVKRALTSLQNKLLVTAVGEQERLSHSWGSYLWGTYEIWEMDLKEHRQIENPNETIEKYLKGAVSNNRLKALLQSI